MIYNGEKYLYIGYIVKLHGDKGKVIALIRRYIPAEKFPSRLFIRMAGEKEGREELREFKIRKIKIYKRNTAILSLDKIRRREEAESLVACDIYIRERELPRMVKMELGILPNFLQEVSEIEPSQLEYIGMITKPRGLKGAVAAVVPKEKIQKFTKYQEILIELEGKLYRTGIRKLKKIKEMADNIYVSLELSGIYDVNSAERLRKGKIFTLTSG